MYVRLKSLYIFLILIRFLKILGHKILVLLNCNFYVIIMYTVNKELTFLIFFLIHKSRVEFNRRFCVKLPSPINRINRSIVAVRDICIINTPNLCVNILYVTCNTARCYGQSMSPEATVVNLLLKLL